MVGLRVMLLGGFEARLASGATLSLPTKKAQALLAYLGIRPGQSCPRDKLAALLWGEKSDGQARGGLRHALVALRRALASATPASLRIEGRTLALNPVGVEVDVAAFERLVAEGTPQALEHAAELYRGDLLLGFTVNEPLFEEWLVSERERLRGTAVGGAQAVPGVRRRAAAGARDRTRGRDEEALSGAASASGQGAGGLRFPRGRSRASRPHGRAGSTRSPSGGDAAVRAAGGARAVATAARGGHPGAGKYRHRDGRSGHRQDATRHHPGGRRAFPRLPGADRPLP